MKIKLPSAASSSKNSSGFWSLSFFDAFVWAFSSLRFLGLSDFIEVFFRGDKLSKSFKICSIASFRLTEISAITSSIICYRNMISKLIFIIPAQLWISFMSWISPRHSISAIWALHFAAIIVWNLFVSRLFLSHNCSIFFIFLMFCDILKILNKNFKSKIIHFLRNDTNLYWEAVAFLYIFTAISSCRDASLVMN